MSGFFMIRRDRFEQLAPQLSTQGFKILLDIIATAQGKLRTIEIPYTFGSRQHGESKLDSMVALDFLGLVLAKLTHDVVSLRFLLFAMVGGTGLVVHLAALFIAHEIFQEPFAEAQAAGALIAMTSNFILNNFLTYRDQRLKGFAILRGLLLFYLVCGVGTARQCRRRVRGLRPGTDLVAAGLRGALMGVVWNYAMSGLFVWRKR
jgi:dolichol-phosphate mannosyltransferase